MGDESAGDRRFVWPPKAATRPVIAPAAEVPALAQPRAPHPDTSLRGVMRELERTWLGLTSAPFEERIAVAEWGPDPIASYCRRCGSTVGPHEADDIGCPACRARKLPWERMVRLGEFTGLLRDMVHEVKFTRWRRLGDSLGRLLGAAINEAMEVGEVDPDRAVLVPVPMSLRRRLWRGIDHATVITRGAAAVTGFPIVMALTRRHTPSQARLPATERRTNVAGSFEPRRGTSLAGFTAILIDDVTTTRATLIAASRAAARCRKSLDDKSEGSRLRLWTAVLGVTPARGAASLK